MALKKLIPYLKQPAQLNTITQQLLAALTKHTEKILAMKKDDAYEHQLFEAERLARAAKIACYQMLLAKPEQYGTTEPDLNRILTQEVDELNNLLAAEETRQQALLEPYGASLLISRYPRY